MKPDNQARHDDSAGCVFVVEDESVVALGLKAMLAQIGRDCVHVFANAEEALARLDDLRPRSS